MSTTHRLPRGTSIAPMPPARVQRGRNRILPGGLAPQPFRSASHKLTRGNKTAVEPFASRQIRVECAINAKWLRAWS
jgi:hypothetical protein